MASGPIDLVSLKTLGSLRRAQDVVKTAAERLATGKRINRGSDDPAGLIASESLEARRRELANQIQGAERAGYVLGAAEGGLAVIQDLLTSLNGLAVKAANKSGLSAAERESTQLEADSVLQAIDYVVATTTFNNNKILQDGATFSIGDSGFAFAGIDTKTLGAARGEVRTPGANPGDPDIVEEKTFTLADVASGRAANLDSGDTQTAQRVIKSALDSISGIRARIGAYQRYDLQSKIASGSVELENTTAAQSSIRDADLAKELTELFRGRILEQASLYSLADARDAYRDRVLGALR